MFKKIISVLISAGILLLIVAAGAWFYRNEIKFWWTGKKAETAPYEGMSAEEHARMGGAAPATGRSAGKTGERKILYWYDPMHPAYKSDKPGTAPDCGMDLVPMYESETPSESKLPPGTVQISPEKQRLIGVQTMDVVRRPLERIVRAVGKVTIDESKVAHVHTKFSGYIEHVYADFVGKQVHTGEPLFTIYSPELVATQQEYLIALRARKQLKDAPRAEISQMADSLVEAAADRLRLWDIHDDEIQRLEREGTVKKYLEIDSPVSGVILERAAYHHGRYVTPELDLYMIVDLSTVWVDAELYEFEAPYIRVGQAATVQMTYLPGKKYVGKVSFIYPNVDPKTRTVKARLEFPNPNMELKPDMFADVELHVGYGAQIAVPQEAVLDSGTQQIVFVAHENGTFEPRAIQTGPKLPGLPGDPAAGEQVIVLRGLRPGESIVTSANFLIDSESRLRSAMPGMQHEH